MRRRGLGRRGMSMKKGIYIFPSLLTSGNLFFGFFSIMKSVAGEYWWAGFGIVMAGILDLVDGRVARATKTTSRFGMQYDSLADMVSFGLAPAVLICVWALQPFARTGWVIPFLFAACTALRLARYNVQASADEKHSYHGLPCPMASLLLAGTVVIALHYDIGLHGLESRWVALLPGILAILMVTTIRYRHFGEMGLRGRKPFTYLVIALLFIVLTAAFPYHVLFIGSTAYVLSGPVEALYRLSARRKQADVPVGPTTP